MTSQTENLTYTIEKTVTVDGVDLPPGSYRGRRVRIGVPYKGQTQWQNWEYKIDTVNVSGLHCDAQVADGSIKWSQA